MCGVLNILLCTLFCVGGATNIFIDSPVRLLDCRSSRQDGQWMIGTTEATSPVTAKPADQRKFYDAARDGNLEYIENEISRLGSSGLNLNWKNPDGKGWAENTGWTALHIAADKNKPSIVSALLSAGADVNVQNDYGETPVSVAARWGHDNIIRLLIDPKYQADIHLAGIFGATPVYVAANEGKTNALKLLLAEGGDPNTVNNEGESPLMRAAWRGYPACARALIAAGANVNYVNPKSPYMGGATALHWAAEYDESEVARVLLEAGATKDIKDKEGKTPADRARDKGNHSIARLIENY